MPTPVIYDPFMESQHDGGAINMDAAGDTIKVMLVTSAYTPAAATHDFIDDANANEVSGTNYTAGGATIGSQTITINAGTIEFDHADVTWSQSGVGFTNARYAIWYKDTGTPSTSPLIMYMDLGADKGNTVGDLVLSPVSTVINISD